MELERYIPQGNVSKLADRPKNSAAELKAVFDEAEKNIGEYINEKLIPEIEEMDAEIGKKANSTDMENMGTDLGGRIDDIGTKCNRLSENLDYHVNNYEENPHNVTASQIPADKDLISPPGTVGWELQELGLSIKAANEDLELHAAQINNPHNVKAEQILVENGEDPLFGEGSTVKQALYTLYDACADASNAVEEHKTNSKNPHNVTKEQVGLSAVDNTSDLDKPLSNAMKTALNGKLSVEMVYNPDDCYSVGISKLYYVFYQFSTEEKGNYYLLSFAENHPEFVTTYPPSENEYTLNVIQYKFAGGDVKKRAGKLFYKEYDGEHTYLDREWGEWSKYVTDAVLEEKIGDIDEALEKIIAIQNRLMGVSE